MLGALGIRGVSTTSHMAKFVLAYNKSAGYEKELEYKEVRKLEIEYSRLLTERARQNRSRKNRDEYYPGIKSNGYAFEAGKAHTGKKMVPTYFLTLKGGFLVLGFKLSDEELINVLKNLAKMSLYFAYIYRILEKTSIRFVNELFIEPIRQVLETTNFFDVDIKFYFINIVELIGNNLQKKMDAMYCQREHDITTKPIEYFNSLITDRDTVDFPNAKPEDMMYSKIQEAIQDEHGYREYLRDCGIEYIIDNTFYYFRIKDDWYDSVVEYFYQDKNSEEFYREHCDDADQYLTYKIMEKVHFTYNSYFGHIPSKPRFKLPRSKRWKKHMKYKTGSDGRFVSKTRRVHSKE